MSNFRSVCYVVQISLQKIIFEEKNQQVFFVKLETE